MAKISVSFLCLILLFLAPLASPPARAQDWDAVELQARELATGVWMLSGAGGNHLLLDTPDGPLLVDSDYREVSEKLLHLVQELTGRAPGRVILTHWHFDHVGGNAALRQAGARIIAHRNVRRRMAAGAHLAVIDHTEPPAGPEELPRLTFDSELTLHPGDETVAVFHVPAAHTGGDAMVFLEKANVLHTGDVVFFCGYPFIDINDGGTIDGVIAGVDRALGLCDRNTRVIPGHGPLTDRDGLQQYRDMLADFREAVATARDGGMTLEQLLDSDVTAQVDARWDGKMFPSAAFKELVFRSLP